MVLFKESRFWSCKTKTDHACWRIQMVYKFLRQSFLKWKEVENLDLAARLADDYSLTHKASFVNKPFPRKPFNPQLKFTPQSRPFSPQSKPYSPQSGPKTNDSNLSVNSSHSFTPKSRFSGKNKVEVLYPIQFEIIVNNHAISFLNV